MGRYAKGKRAFGECQRSGKRVPYHQLVEDGHIDGLLVAPDWWEPRHPQEIPVRLDDPVGLVRVAPESKPPEEGIIADPVGVEPLVIRWENVRLEDRVWSATIGLYGGTSPMSLIVSPTEEYIGILDVSGNQVTYREQPGEEGAWHRVELLAQAIDSLDDFAEATIVAEIPSAPVAGATTTVLEVRQLGDSDQTFMYFYAGPTGMTPSGGFPPFSLDPPIFSDLYPDWNFFDPLIPEQDTYPEVWVVAGWGNENTDLTITVRAYGDTPTWSASDAASADVAIISPTTGGPSYDFTVTVRATALVQGDPYTGQIDFTASFNGGASTQNLRVNFGFTLNAV